MKTNALSLPGVGWLVGRPGIWVIAGGDFGTVWHIMNAFTQPYYLGPLIWFTLGEASVALGFGLSVLLARCFGDKWIWGSDEQADGT